MWQQQQPQQPSSPIDSSELLSDSSGRGGGFPHGGIPSPGSPFTEELQWKSGFRGHESVSRLVSRDTTSPSPVKGLTEGSKCQSLYDSGRTDSGFLSGANILSDQCLSSDEVSSKRQLTSNQDLCSSPLSDVSKSPEYMRSDSGVCVDVDRYGLSVSDQLSQLSLGKTKSSLNDLNFSSKSTSSVPLTTINALPTSNINIVEQETQQQQQQQKTSDVGSIPWELYYQPDEDGDTQLHIAIIQGFIEVAYSLIRIALHPCLLDIVNNNGQAPLHLAVLTKQPHVARRLLVAGAAVDIRNRHGNTALHLAAALGDLECVKALTEPITVAETQSASLCHPVIVRQLPQDLELRNYDGQMCVHLASMNGHADVVRHLVWFGANINARDGTSGRTPLHCAIERRDLRLLLTLLTDLPVDLEAPTYAGYTPYQLASCCGEPRLAAELLRRGANQRDVPDSSSESDSDSDDEMFAQTDNFFHGLRINGGAPINISA